MLATLCAFGASPAAAEPVCQGDVVRWSSDVHALRPVRGHFAGGTWQPDVDRWEGRLHTAMHCTAAHAAAHRASASAVKTWLGRPDDTLTCPSAACNALRGRAPDLPVAEVLWVYKWRGSRDQLVFALKGKTVAASAWVHDFEL